MRRSGGIIAAVTAATAAAFAPARMAVAASPDGLAPLAQRCLRADEIQAARVISDEAVVLFLSDGRVALMRLKRRCPQLLFHHRFRFTGELGQICAELDRIVTRAGLRCSIAGFYALPCPQDDVEGIPCTPPTVSDHRGLLPEDEEEGS